MLMDEITRSAEYARKRMQALRNCESHIANVLWKAAQQIVSKSAKYRRAGRLTNESSLLSDAKKITADAEANIDGYISAYAKASCKILGIDDGDTETFLKSAIFGKTTHQRNTTYLANFAEDIVRMIKAGTLMGYSDRQILSAVRTGYKDPYKTSVVTKAQRKEFDISTPSYGKGIFRNAYQNIVRNAKQVVSIAWGKAEQTYGLGSGAVGFMVHRGSSYPCSTCQDEVDRGVHGMGDNFPPFHTRCVCYVEFIYNKSKQE